ncbi:cytochrome P450 [Microbacterium sp. GXF0217]
MVAVARFTAFAGLRLHTHPQWRARIAEESAARGALTGGPIATAFAQEIRRTAPFVPMLPGRAVADVELDGQRVSEGGRVVLDILGTNLDAASWADAQRFAPERFIGQDDYEAIEEFIPHGGGSVPIGHRCPGEKLAIAGLATAVSALSDSRVTILGARLDVNRRRLPTMPASGALVRATRGATRCPAHR